MDSEEGSPRRESILRDSAYDSHSVIAGNSEVSLAIHDGAPEEDIAQEPKKDSPPIGSIKLLPEGKRHSIIIENGRVSLGSQNKPSVEDIAQDLKEDSHPKGDILLFPRTNRHSIVVENGRGSLGP